MGAPAEEPGQPSGSRDGANGASSSQPETKPAPKLEPFSDDEILGGIGFVAMLGLRAESSAEVEAFERSFTYVIPPVLKTSQLLKPLKLGEALASYGIGKGMMPGSNGLEALPGWARLAVGGLVVAVATVGGVRASREVRSSMAEESPQMAASGAGSAGAAGNPQ